MQPEALSQRQKVVGRLSMYRFVPNLLVLKLLKHFGVRFVSWKEVNNATIYFTLFFLTKIVAKANMIEFNSATESA
jgi:hypothetical protein